MLTVTLNQMDGRAKSTIVNKIKQDFLEIKRQQHFGLRQVVPWESTFTLGRRGNRCPARGPESGARSLCPLWN